MQSKQDVISHITDNLRRVFQIVNEQSQRIKRQTGLTGPQLWAIGVIDQHGPINISNIARRMYLHPTTVLGIVDRLEARGLVVRTRSKEDRRVIWVELTDAGKSVVEAVPEVIHGLFGAGLAQIDLGDLTEIDDGIGHLVTIFGLHQRPPKPMFF